MNFLFTYVTNTSKHFRNLETTYDTYNSDLRQRLAPIRPVRPGPNAIRITRTSLTRVQLIALNAGMRVAHLEAVDRSERRRVSYVAADLVRAALAAPDAIVGRLYAGNAIGEQFAEFFVRAHATRRCIVQTAHVFAVVRVIRHQDVFGDF